MKQLQIADCKLQVGFSHNLQSTIYNLQSGERYGPSHHRRH
jgi:hypothetical protein